MEWVQALMRRLDGFQQRHPLIGYPLAVVQKLNDDQGGNLAAVLAWNAFIAVFPLLLVLTTVLGLVLRNRAGLHEQVLHSALTDFPIIGTQLRQNIHSLNRTGIGLAIGLVGTFLGARGVASAAQTAFNSLWAVPYKRRPGFPHNLLRGLALLICFGLGIIATTSLSGLGGGVNVLGIGVRVAAVALALILNVGLFWLAFRLATAAEVASRDLRLGAFLTAIAWQVLQTFGSYLVAHQLRHATQVYGLFGLVLGLASWLYLQALVTLYLVEADVVRTRRLWPRSFFADKLTHADKRAFTAYAKTEERKPEEQVDVAFDDNGQ